MYHAIADPNRRRLLDLLSDQEYSVQELVPHFQVTFGAISQHLRILRESGLVTRRKQGRFRYYRARPLPLEEVHQWTARYRQFWESRLDRLTNYLDDAP